MMHTSNDAARLVLQHWSPDVKRKQASNDLIAAGANKECTADGTNDGHSRDRNSVHRVETVSLRSKVLVFGAIHANDAMGDVNREPMVIDDFPKDVDIDIKAIGSGRNFLVFLAGATPDFPCCTDV